MCSKILFPTVLFFLMSALQAQAQSWKTLKKIAAAPITIPAKAAASTVKTSINVVQGKTKPKEVVTQFRETATTPAKDLISTAEDVTSMRSTLHNYLADHVGHAGEFILDMGDFSESYANSTAIAASNYANVIIEGGSLASILGAPLAAAIREAKDRFSSKAMPIPPDVVAELRKRGFDSITLRVARYAVGTVEIALPNFVSRAKRYFQHQEVAVTVDNIIVFPEDPGTLYRQNCYWWAHELTHVTQYRTMGIEAFAYSYSQDLLARKAYENIRLEAEAIAHGNQITDNENCNSQAGAFKVQKKITALNQLFPKPVKPDTIRYFTNVLKPNEKYIAQCFVPNGSLSAMFLVTNEGRIIAINPISGEAIHIGYAKQPTPPNAKKYLWIFDLPGTDYDYGIFANGRIEKAAG